MILVMMFCLREMLLASEEELSKQNHPRPGGLGSLQSTE